MTPKKFESTTDALRQLKNDHRNKLRAAVGGKFENNEAVETALMEFEAALEAIIKQNEEAIAKAREILFQVQ